MRRNNFRILTVGDGDLTCSLALARAYGNNNTSSSLDLNLVASTLLSSPQEVINTYSNTTDVLQELQERNVSVRYNVDATHLHDTMNKNEDKWDAILFHHPHLGTSQEENEQVHARRHFVLLAHYFFSAKQCLRQDGIVHVCLCGHQADTWNVMPAAQRQGLVLQQTIPTTIPIHVWLFPNNTPISAANPVLSHYPAPRRYRNDKLGSKHFLGRYGYRHRRTHGDLHSGGSGADVNVAGSLHYVFEMDPNYGTSLEQTSETECNICGMTFESILELQQHYKAPALPDPVDVALSGGSTKNGVASVDTLNSLDNDTVFASATAEKDNAATSSIDTGKLTNSLLKNTEIDTSNAIRSSLVKEEHDTKRLRWFLRQQSSLGNNDKGLSKAMAERMIQAGRVALNGTVVVDSARRLHTGDQISLLQEPTTTAVSKATTASLEVHYQSTHLVVVFKPVGMRTIGSFSSETLEMTVSAQIKESFKALSKMDTGCSGLCVLQRRHDDDDAHTDNVQVSHVFTALVHGHVPKSWNGRVLVLSNEGRRQWRRKDGDMGQGNDDDEHVVDDANKNNVVEICILETTKTPVMNPALSTVAITTCSNTSRLCNAICFLLRKHGHPVVNDRLCRREYLTLPRSIRNLIKNRLCIGCYEVKICTSKGMDEECSKSIRVDLPDRLRATHWQSHLSKQTDVS